MVGHADVGDRECCGCLYPVERGAEADSGVDIVCNEYGAVIRTTTSMDEALDMLPKMA
jgi:hypothetical protein